MKTIDANYSYNELEGFSPIVVTKMSSRFDIWLSVSKNWTRISAEARKVLLQRDFISFFFNPERKQLLLISCPEPSKSTIRITKSSSHGLHCAALRDLLEKELRIDLTNHTIRIPGTIARSKKNAVIFELSQFESRKVGSLKK